MLAPGNSIQGKRARNRRPRRLPLRLAELGPVDASLPWVHVLLHELSRKLFEPAVDFPLDERGRKFERDAFGQLLEQLGAKLPRGVLFGLGLQIGANPIAQRGDRVEFPDILRKLVVEFREHTAAKLFRRD